MADSLTVTFSYTVGSARFNCEAEVDPQKWESLGHQDRIDYLREAALEDVDDNLEIEEDSVEEDTED